MKHIPRKRFGQNFLQDQGIIYDIVQAVDPQPDDNVAEIGPGLAAITRPLLDRLPRLTVIEIDRDIVARLQKNWSADRLCIHNADALLFDFSTLGPRLRLVGNLPYNISTPLLFHLASFHSSIYDMHFMLQKEVVERMVAEPGSGDYGRLSVMLQYRYCMEKLLDVPPHAFDPPPKVDSAVVRLIPWPQPELPALDEAVFADLVARAFSQRRKTLRNVLRDMVSDEDFAAAGIDAGLRPENLSVADYVRLANHLAARRGQADTAATSG